MSSTVVVPLDTPVRDLEVLGGKGASLARLVAAGIPVPDGFHVTTAAYAEFVITTGIRAEILELTTGLDGDDQRAVSAASRRIRELFDAHAVPAAMASAIRAAYVALGPAEPAVAVRSSATAEDLPGMSFAGQQDSFLNVAGADRVVDAVRRCWASLWTDRAITYRARNGIRPDDVSIAVVVQLLVPAESSGVLFTADPLTGDRERIVINAAWGLGEALVGGQVTPDVVVADRGTGRVVEHTVADKGVMTVRTAAGTDDVVVPDELRRQAVLSDGQATELSRLAKAIDDLYGVPMDIEWARADGRFHILQARPITGTGASTAPRDTWNHSTEGCYLWTNSNLGEAVPDVMTPCSWSLIEMFMIDAMAANQIDGHRLYGRIGGRFYMNLSTTISVAAAFGQKKRAVDGIEPVFGRLPDGLDVPLVRMGKLAVLRDVVPMGISQQKRVKANLAKLPDFLTTAPGRAQALRADIERAAAPGELVDLWSSTVAPFFRESCHMLEAATRQGKGALTRTPVAVKKRLGETLANVVLSGAGSGAALASLETIVGLEALAGGTIDEHEFVQRYGHRGPSELEVSAPRPAEDSAWLKRQLAAASSSPVSVRIADRDEERATAWREIEAKRPRAARRLRKRVARWSQIARDREAARSEVVRSFWVLRAFVVRAGQLTGLHDDIFMLSIDEVLDALAGRVVSAAEIASRRDLYEHYRSLPPYPTLIVGAFDPERWAADPQRRSDLFDARGAVAPIGAEIVGFAGAAGVVEARARVVATPEEGESLEPGEVLVTTITNVGWTPLFSRAAAVVTDVGAPLSHAAIVARELGIPAVVGTGNATMRLRTGDLIRVDGAAGRVELLAEADAER